MNDNSNTIAGWVLAGCFAALGLTIVGGMISHGEKPKKEGYPIEAVAEDTGGGDAAPVEPIANRLAKADAAKGAETFKKCAACHSINQGGANGIGPNLYATVGEAEAEGKAGYAFSDALKAHGGAWTFEDLDSWLTSPRKYAPGTKMSFAGLSNPQDRADVILYLNQQGSNKPLPAPVAAAAPAAAAGNTTQAAPADGKAPTTTSPAATGNTAAPAK